MGYSDTLYTVFEIHILFSLFPKSMVTENFSKYNRSESLPQYLPKLELPIVIRRDIVFDTIFMSPTSYHLVILIAIHELLLFF